MPAKSTIAHFGRSLLSPKIGARMEHEQPHHHKHHREEPHHTTGGGRKLPFHPGWFYGVGIVLTIIVILVWTLLI